MTKLLPESLCNVTRPKTVKQSSHLSPNFNVLRPVCNACITDDERRFEKARTSLYPRVGPKELIEIAQLTLGKGTRILPLDVKKWKIKKRRSLSLMSTQTLLGALIIRGSSPEKSPHFRRDTDLNFSLWADRSKLLLYTAYTKRKIARLIQPLNTQNVCNRQHSENPVSGLGKLAVVFVFIFRNKNPFDCILCKVAVIPFGTS